MEWPETLCLLIAATALYVWAMLRERRPADLTRPRMIPSVPVMAVCAVIIMLMLAHLVTLLTGTPFQGSGGF